MVDITTWFWIGAAGMAFGTLAFIAGAITDKKSEIKYYAILASITFVAFVAYVAMALEKGVIDVNGESVYLPRYIDWVITTPLIVLYLGLLAGVEKKTYAALVASDVAVIGFGIGATLVEGTTKYTLYGVSMVAYLALLYLLVKTLSKEAHDRSDAVAALFQKLRNLTVVLWTVYPIVWILAPTGLGLMNQGTEVLIVTYLDLITKVGFGFIALNSRDALIDITGSRNERAADGGLEKGK